MKKIGVGLLAVIGVLVILFAINPQIRPSHTTPYQNLVDEGQGAAPEEEAVLQRVILYGDAGHSSMEPWQPSMAAVAARAAHIPGRTTVVALGDNIYYMGYPTKEADQEEWNESQLESISYLDAQLRVARESGARMYLVPGNHDWYASELDGQAAHVASYAERHGLNLFFEPYEQGQPPWPERVDLDGVSIAFLDSEWLLRSTGEDRLKAFATLDEQISASRREYPDNLVIVTAHHPLDTNGPHGGYLAEFGYWFIMNLLYLVTPAAEEDTFSEIYQQMIADIDSVAAKYDNVIYAAGHEHSLQVFRRPHDHGPEYTLVSGAGNTSKVSGVWHDDNTRFALSREGFMELDVTAAGSYLKIYSIDQQEPVSGFWLSF